MVPPAEGIRYRGLQFGADDDYVYYVRNDPENPNLSTLFQTPILGGNSRQIIKDIDSNISFAPDGRHFSFIRGNTPSVGQFQIVSGDLSGGQAAVVFTGSNQAPQVSAWSPNGKEIAAQLFQEGESLDSLATIDVNGGKPKIFLSTQLNFFSNPTWLPGGKGLLVLYTDIIAFNNRSQIGYVSYPGGDFRRVTNDTNNYSDLSLSGDGKTLATILNESNYGLSVIPASSNGSELDHQAESHDAAYAFVWTHAGKILVDRENKIARTDPETGQQDPILSDKFPSFLPVECGDGRYIFFASAGRAGNARANLWRIESDGSNLKQMTEGKADLFPACTSSGKSIYYLDLSAGNILMRVPLEGGKAERLAGPGISRFALSSDGKLIAEDVFAGPREQFKIADAETGAILKEINAPTHAAVSMQFTPDDKAVAFVIRDKGIDNIWTQPVDGGPAKQITKFATNQITEFGWSRDGKKLALVRGHVHSDVVLIREATQ